jgi:prolyl-tRNA editing enzyme YbaK/EbsC (Cys-tRNA(Pro) deacylase)
MGDDRTGARGVLRRRIVTDALRERVLLAAGGAGAKFEAMECDPDLADTATFCEHYGIPLERSANTIVLASKRPPGVFGVFIVLANTRLDVNGKARALMDVKKVSFAPADTTAEVTGMIMGGVTPFGLPDELPIFVDRAVLDEPWVVVGGGTRDLKLKVDPDIFRSLASCTVVEDLARPFDLP